LPWPLTPSALTSASVVIVVVGESPYAEGGGDRREVSLAASDARLIAAVADGKRRVVLLTLSGRPLYIPPDTLDQADALLACWLPGTEGDGVADVLFGDVAPSGRLSFAWPRTATQMLKSQRTDEHALFPLHFGLSYT